MKSVIISSSISHAKLPFLCRRQRYFEEHWKPNNVLPNLPNGDTSQNIFFCVPQKKVRQVWNNGEGK